MPAPDDAHEELFRREGGRLFGLAYRMLGSVTEAEDVVQDAFLRWSSADRSDVVEPGAWLTTAATRLCLDRLKAARRRETYVGTWLPEPLPTRDVDPADLAATGDSLTYAFLVVLETLSPLERVVLILHDVFGHPHDQIAAMVGRTPAAVRKAASRARRRVEERPTAAATDPRRDRAVVEAFLEATRGGDLDTMIGLLAPEVEFVGDGGGVATAIGAPLRGAGRVAAVVAALWRTGTRVTEPRMEVVEANGQPAVWVREGDETAAVLVVDVVDGRIAAIRGVRNPAKFASFVARLA